MSTSIIIGVKVHWLGSVGYVRMGESECLEPSVGLWLVIFEFWSDIS